MLAGGAAALYWLRPGWLDDGLWEAILADDGPPRGFAVSNGRIEATEVDVATKLAGRLTRVSAREGDRVEDAAVVARLDTESLEAQLRQAKAELRRSRQEREHARAVVAQRESELEFARRDLHEQALEFGSVFVPRDGILDAKQHFSLSAADGSGAIARLAENHAAHDSAFRSADVTA